MTDDPTEEMVKKEVAEAVRILREDGVHIHKTYARFLAGKDDKKDDKDEGKANDKDKGEGKDKEGGPPPVKDSNDPPEPRKVGIWWGGRLDASS